MDTSHLPDLRDAVILVTGGAGFIGSHLSGALLQCGAEVIAFDDLSQGKTENIEHLSTHPSFVFHRGDANVYEHVRDVFIKYPIDYVFHYAAVVGVRRVIEQPLTVFKDIEGAKNILELALLRNVKKIIYSSSSEAYGEPVQLPEREEGTHNLHPRDPYGLVKIAGEQMMYYHFKHYGLKTCALRFFNAYGPRQESSPYGFVVGVFMRRLLEGKPPLIFGDGMQTRDFVYVDDNVEAAIRALVRDETNGETINIGSGRQTTILDLAERIIDLAGKRGEMQPEFEPLRPIEIRYRAPDVTKMKNLIGFTPRVGFDEGLRQTWEWYKQKFA